MLPDAFGSAGLKRALCAICSSEYSRICGTKTPPRQDCAASTNTVPGTKLPRPQYRISCIQNRARRRSGRG
eukprot:3500722-Rhodomonas_salina.1